MKSYFLKIAALLIVPVSISLAAAPCNNTVLKGRYLLLADGTQGNDPSNAVAAIRFDGHGHFTGSGMVSSLTKEYVPGGAYSISSLTTKYQSAGTYLVAKDCTVRIDEYFSPSSTSMPYTQTGILANGGTKIFAIPTESNKNLSLIYEKQ